MLIPLAVALSNTSHPGTGYPTLSRRRRLIVAAPTITVILIATLIFAALVLIRSRCAAVVDYHGRGWALAWRPVAGTRPTAKSSRQLLLATAVTVRVLLTMTLIRIDTGVIDRSIAESRARGDGSSKTDVS